MVKTKKAKPETQALIAELSEPTHFCTKRCGSARRAVVPLVEQMQAQATQILRLHADFIDAEDNKYLRAMQEELRQKALAMRRVASELEERAHAAYQIAQDVERFTARFLEVAALKVEAPE